MAAKSATKLAIAVAIGLCGLAGHALAASSPWSETDHGAVRLIAATDAVGTAERLNLGLQFRMKPDWKIYWRSPGDAGFPPRINWAGSENLAEARLRWPAPKRFSVLGLETMGYGDRVVLPISVTPFEPGKALRLRATVDYLTCAEICVPYHAKLALDLPAGPESDTRESGLIGRYAARVPATDGSSGLTVAAAEIEGRAPVQFLTVILRSDRPLKAPDLFVEGPRGFGFAAPRRIISGDRREAVLRVAVQPSLGKDGIDSLPLVGRPLRLTVVDGARAVEQSVVPIAAAGGMPQAASFGLFAKIIALALLGGLILNLMPCVLPVLSLKLLAVVGHVGGEARAVRRGFLASAAGIVVSFLILATGAAAFIGTGRAAGWGIQFQEPLFLVAMTLVLTLFAANLWGWFEVRLSGAVADAAVAAGGGRDRESGLVGHFLTGALATLLATPCSAPFLGTAVGFALARGPLEIYAIFAALGLGLAFPYLVIASRPGLATRLPRPGSWMVTIRRVLGLALVATAIWLISVLAVQSGDNAAIVVALLAALVLAALWFKNRVAGLGRRAVWGAVGAMALASLLVPGRIAPPDAVAYAGAGLWRLFDRVAIAHEVAAGRIVLVDVTAEWCLTCKINKSLVLDRGELAGAIESGRVIAMRADWTRPDARIAAYLASFGRYGIPFNVVYGPKTPDGVALDEILTVSAVLEAISRAGGGAVVTAR